MSTTQWIIGLVVVLVAGGAMGAIIGILANNWRNRIQPIEVWKEVIPFVNQQIEGSAPKAEILLRFDGKERSYSNLKLGRITLENTSNKDYEDFNFGVTLSGLSMAVYIQTDSQDRYHEISSSPDINFERLDNEIDFSLKPFNRKDSYSVVLFIIPIPDDPLEMNLSTKHPVKFVTISGNRKGIRLRGVLFGLVSAITLVELLVVGIAVYIKGSTTITSSEGLFVLIALPLLVVGVFATIAVLPSRIRL
jgi:hypothetical protein